MGTSIDSVRRDYRETTARIRELMGKTARDYYELGEALRDARERQVHRGGPHRTFETFVRVEFGMSGNTARKLMAVAEQFNPDVAKRFGLPKLEAAIDYARATRRREEAGDLLALRVAVPGEDGRFVNKAVRDATPGELRAATRRVRKSKHGGGRTPARLRAAAEALEARLRDDFADESFALTVRIWRAEANGEYLMTISGVPVKAVPGAGRVMASWRGE